MIPRLEDILAEAKKGGWTEHRPTDHLTLRLKKGDDRIVIFFNSSWVAQEAIRNGYDVALTELLSVLMGAP